MKYDKEEYIKLIEDAMDSLNVLYYKRNHVKTKKDIALAEMSFAELKESISKAEGILFNTEPKIIKKCKKENVYVLSERELIDAMTSFAQLMIAQYNTGNTNISQTPLMNETCELYIQSKTNPQTEK